MSTKKSSAQSTTLHDQRWQTMAHCWRNKDKSKGNTGMCHTEGGNTAGKKKRVAIGIETASKLHYQTKSTALNSTNQ